jgi:signal transduction histidine kinase/ActR/RegA family two-component response regulator
MHNNPVTSLPAEKAEGPVRAQAFVQELLVAPPDFETVGSKLTGLAQAFGVRSAGLAVRFGEGNVLLHRFSAKGEALPCLSVPGHDRPELLGEALSTPLAVPAETPTGEALLLTALAQPEAATWQLWLSDRIDRVWNEEERASLALALLAWQRCFTAPCSAAWRRWLDRARRQRRLEDAARVVSRLVHDFNNVLTGVIGFVELTQAQVPNGSPAQQFLNEVAEAAQQGTKLIGRLSAFCKRGTGRSVPSKLEAILTSETTRVQSARGESIQIQVLAPEGLAAVAIENESLRLIVGHLLDNACEAISTTGKVAIAVRVVELTALDCMNLLGETQPGAHVEIAITDTGTGLTPEARERALAEPLFSTKPRHRGLGLASVYGALCRHRGGLRLDEGPEGRGCTVRVFLPVATMPAVISPVVIPCSTQKTNVTGEKVLVVDDDPQTLQLMCTTLQRAGYQVKQAADAQQALDSVAEAAEPFRLVLSDVVMPQMTGFDLALRLLDRNPRTNLLFTSGHIAPGTIPATIAGLNFTLLPKPFRADSLLRAVRSALDQPPCAATPAAQRT